MSAPPRVLVEGLVFNNTYQRGIQRYIQELLARVSCPFTLLTGGPSTVPLNPGWPVVQRREYGIRPQYNFIKRGLHTLRRRFPSRSVRGYDLFHSTYFQLPPDPTCPCVVVVYDMVCELLPPFYGGDATKEASHRYRAMQRADAIITISHATRDDLLRVYPEFRGRVFAIPLGAEHVAAFGQPPIEKKPASGPPYALFVGDRAGYKNFNTVLKAMLEPAWPDGMKLKVAGPTLTQAEMDEIAHMGLSRRVEACGRISDAELAAFYQNAAVFLFPSLLEGFGFPLLEAQLLGVPVAASRTPIFQEVGGTAFEPFDPMDSSSLANAVVAASRPVRGAELCRLGKENALRFSWDKTARETEAVWATFAREGGNC